jgi:hypothetical protein
MKNHIIIILLVITTMGCKKSAQKTSSTTTPPGPSSNQTTLNDTTMAKAALIGHWVLDSMVYYQNDVPTVVKHTSAATTDNYVYDLFSTPYASSNQQMQMNYGLSGGTQNSGAWYVNAVWLSSKGKLFLSSSGTFMPGYIYLLTTTHLMTADNYATVKQGYCYYFHK